MDLELNNKHVIITGASGGIGTEIVRLFLAEGAKVTAHFNTTNSTLQEFVTSFPDNFYMISADLRHEEEVHKLFSQATKKFGKIDSLIANAGVWPKQHVPIHKMSFERWQNTLAVDLTSIFLSTKYFITNLESNPGDFGSIVLIGSTAGLVGEAGHADYASAKAAMVGFMRSIKNEIVQVAKKGRINLINPGWTVTPMAKDALKDTQAVKRILQTIPMRKIASPKDIANTIVYLCSESAAGHITGQTITIAGGLEGRVLFEREEIEL